MIFPDEELYGRKKHDNRPVVVVQDNYYNNYPLFKIITIAPISTKDKYKTNLDIELKEKINGVLCNSYIRLYLIQPILKIHLLNHINKLSDEKIDELKAALIFFWGLS